MSEAKSVKGAGEDKSASAQSEDVQARLSRELAAQALSADSYQNLANRRAHLLTKLNKAFEEESSRSKVSNLRKKKYTKNTDTLAKTAIQSGLSVLLRTLKDASRYPSALVACFSFLR